MRVLYVAEIVGKAGVYAVKKALPKLVREKNIDFVIAGADGATGGSGLGKAHAIYLRKLGIDVLVMGDCAFFKKDIVEYMSKTSSLLRPVNYPEGVPGRGWRAFETPAGRVAVAVLQGQSGFPRSHLDNPFTMFDALVNRLRREAPIVIIDFHAGPTAEKQTLFAMAQGKVSAVIGSHTRVATADARILPGGTAVVADAGRTGSIQSVGGLDAETRIREYRSGIPDWSKDAWAGIELQAYLLDIDDKGVTTGFERVRVPVEAPRDVEGNGSGKDDDDFEG
jgi:metallophosphoesterase (TIGR00282 family)